MTAEPLALHDDACPSCGTPMKEATATLKLPVNGEEVSVPKAAHLKCPECGEVVLRRDHARGLREAALARYRTKHDLLSGEEIRSIRERHNLTQGQMVSLLRLGANTLSRWESGRNVQTAAMDVLMRLIRDVPGTLDYLHRQAA
jgi:putative zinc finger/helix-turn-helix YgiT family protein